MTTATLNTNLTSAGVKAQIQDLISRLNNPNLISAEYSQIRYEFVKLNEASFNQIYDDQTGKVITSPSQAIGKVTVGVGFNMDRVDARSEWNAAFGSSISFDDVYNNRVQLTNSQVRQLFDYSAIKRENELFGNNGIYKNIAGELTANQMLAIEDMYFNLPSLVKGTSDGNGKYTGTSFFKNLDQYAKTGNQNYLDEALTQILTGSNKANDTGISNRRLKEAAILSGDAEIKLPDSEVRELFNANKGKFDVRIDGKSEQEYFDNQIKANGLSIDTSLFFDDSKFFTSESDPRIMLADSGMIGSDALSPLEEAIIRLKDSEGKEFSLVKDVLVPLKDGTIATINTVLETIDSAKTTAETFINGYMGQVKEMLTNQDAIAGLISDVAAGIQRGDSPEEIAKFVATKLAVKQLLEQGSDAIKNQIQQLLVNNPADIAAIEAGDYSSLSSEGAESLRELDEVINSSAFNFGYRVAIVYATTMLLNADEGWDSQEYSEAAVHAVAQVTTQVAVSIAVKEGWLGSSSSAGPAGAGVGAFAAYMASTAINDLFADDHMNSHQWKSATVSAAVIGVASAIGWALGGPIGAVVASVIVSQFMGGKEYGPGEYPDPYSYLKIEAKEDGTGNKIIAIESEGVVAIAREYYHDDLYGNSGSDNLIGKSGTNTIYGYGGNDHLEGRGDIDLLVGGEGDDEAFGGNGDDQIYGGAGKDNLFGGAGNDQILGGEDNDFIQGGTGDDQIMGEAGNDIIQGNAGSDTILGGAGNDTIQGNEGDDSILGEDGDDLIIAGAGSDIIDGGAGVDVIQGNEGNDNIRGGDGNDEIYGNEGVDIIYGDEGNDLINAGADNDLVFGGIGNDIIYGAAGENSLYGEIGNDYVIGGENNDTIDGGADDDVLLGGLGNDTITTGIGNDTIIFRSGDGQDTIDEADTITNYSIDEVGDDTIYLSDLTSKLSDDSTNRVVLTKSGDDLVIQFKDDSGALTTDQITIKNQLSGDGEIVKKIERIIANDNFENIFCVPRKQMLNHH